ncbi:hypothetical protein C8R45DRAFT_1161753 [Mycena sanguinolenta]|nr:hypothetical protein C8R45DRAFT_1161753 [Mycena sanguinolenta]
MSRQTPPAPPTPSQDNEHGSSLAGVESLLEQLRHSGDVPSTPSDAHNHHSTHDNGNGNSGRMSAASEGYPSWLPRRPLHPAPPPTSTFHSEREFPVEPVVETETPPVVGGRKATPRSVRIVSLQQEAAAGQARREPTEPRVWSRAMGTPLLAQSQPHVDRAQPRFRAKGLHLELLRYPSPWMRLYFLAWPLLVFAHVPLQTFFDFNALFVLVQIALHPAQNSTGKNWSLAAAAYALCWALWLVGVVVMYEGVYCFVRRWRAKRPPVLALYLSAPGFALVGLTSYTNFCFFQRVRWGGVFRNPPASTHTHEKSESAPQAAHGKGYSSATAVDVTPPTPSPLPAPSTRTFLAETANLYAQNGPTVALLLPRAGICLAVLLAFWAPRDDGALGRDATFFRADGALTGYARGVLSANAAWAAWRAVVCLAGWVGLWLLSGAPCAGLCGPRHRWEESATEKSLSMYADDLSDADVLPWRWREETAARVRRAWEFCVTGQKRRSEVMSGIPDLELGREGGGFEGMEQVMAAIGFPRAVAAGNGAGTGAGAARRGVLSGELFEGPSGAEVEVPPKAVQRTSRDREKAVVYPFTGPTAQVSSRDRVPFPPSPGPPEPEETSGSLEEAGEEDEEEDEEDEEEEDEEEEDEEEEDEEELEEEEEEGLPGSEEPSSGRASGSMSSLGQPVSSRYPFQFRRPGPARGASVSSSNANTHSNTHSQSAYSHTHTHSRSTGTRGSVGTRASASVGAQSRVSQSTGNVESTTSSGSSPHSARTSSSSGPGPSTRHNSAGLALPPRHPHTQQGHARGRTRAGTVPVPSSSSSAASVSVSVQPPVDFPRSAVRERMDSATSTFGAGPQPGAPHDPQHDAEHEGEHEHDQQHDAPESEGSHEGEREDRVGLLSSSNPNSAGPSPRPSLTALRQRASNLSLNLPVPRRGYTHSHHSGSGSASGSAGSRTHSRTQSGSSGSRSRSRAGSISVGFGVSDVRERAQSLLQGISAAAGSGSSSGERVGRIRANSSMARLEEDNYYSDARTGLTHSRNGSGTGSDAVPSSGGENNTFGHPLRSTWHTAPTQEVEVEERPQQQPPSPVQEGSEEGREAEMDEHALHPAQSRSSVFSAQSSVFSAPSVATATELQRSRAPSPQRLQAESAGIPIPVVRAPQGQDLGLSSPSSYGDAGTGVGSFSSYPDISTAPQSFVTAPATVEGSTTESSGGRTEGLDSWGVAAGAAHIRDPSRGGHGQTAWGHHGPA